jgi:hypothetical protein
VTVTKKYGVLGYNARRFGRIYRHHLQVRRAARNQQKLAERFCIQQESAIARCLLLLVSCVAYFFTLQMEAVYSFETSVFL